MSLRAGVRREESRRGRHPEPSQPPVTTMPSAATRCLGRERSGTTRGNQTEGVNIVAEEEREQQDAGADDEQGEQPAEGGGSVVKGAATGAVAGATIGAAAAAAQSRFGGSEGESDDPAGNKADEAGEDEAQ